VRAIYAGLLIGFAIACYWLSRADNERFIIPLALAGVAVVVAIEKEG